MLYIMRHGKTDWNSRRKLQGRSDIPLNDEGREMAKKAASEYRDVHFDICYCSPLIRAKETAELVLAGRNIPIVTDIRLQEMSFGVFEGIEKSFEIPNCPINVLFQQPENFVSVQGGESLEDLFQRTGEFLDEIVKPALQKGLDILIIGHGVMNCSIISQVRNLPLERFWSEGIENCKLKQLIP